MVESLGNLVVPVQIAAAKLGILLAEDQGLLWLERGLVVQALWVGSCLLGAQQQQQQQQQEKLAEGVEKPGSPEPPETHGSEEKIKRASLLTKVAFTKY